MISCNLNSVKTFANPHKRSYSNSRLSALGALGRRFESCRPDWVFKEWENGFIPNLSQYMLQNGISDWVLGFGGNEYSCTFTSIDAPASPFFLVKALIFPAPAIVI